MVKLRKSVYSASYLSFCTRLNYVNIALKICLNAVYVNKVSLLKECISF